MTKLEEGNLIDLASTVIYSQYQEHPSTKPNEPKCIRYGRIGPQICESVDKERILGMPHRCGEEGGARAAIKGAKTYALLELAE